MTKKPLIPQDIAVQRLEDALRLRVGRGKRYSFAGLSEATGIAERTLESYVQGASPSLGNILSLFSVLGPGFTSDILSVVGQVARDGSNDDPDHMRALCSVMGIASELAASVEDGYVDHVERAKMRPLAQEAIDLLEPIARGTVVPIGKAGQHG